jgi:pseudaminic acid synthase
MKIIAELSANHLGSLKRALAIVDEAAKAGADAIKLQTFTPEQMVEPGTLIKSGPWAGSDALDLYREAHTPREWHEPLFERAHARGLIAFSSVFHPDDVDFLESLRCPIYKIASFELTDHRLIRYAAETGKPIVLSTGMASLQEIAGAAVAATLHTTGAPRLTVLKCTSAYPASPADANLATMADLRKRYGCAVGLSDHTKGIGVAVAAAALGADMIEKHLTLRRSDGGLDAAFSMEPAEFRAMVTECRRAAEALGEVRYGPSAAEEAHLQLRRAPGGKRAA